MTTMTAQDKQLRATMPAKNDRSFGEWMRSIWMERNVMIEDDDWNNSSFANVFVAKRSIKRFERLFAGFILSSANGETDQYIDDGGFARMYFVALDPSLTLEDAAKYRKERNEDETREALEAWANA